MLADSPRIKDLDDLRSYVQQIICEKNDLEVHAFSMTERILVRAGKPCGLFFCLHGPRSVKFTAIWETDHNSVLFYSPTGERTQKSQLAHVPSLVAQPA
jgi:hypothetical protein